MVQATMERQISGVQHPVASRQIAAPAQLRNVAVDAYRGLVMLLMMGEIMQFAKVAQAFPGSLFWRILAFNQTHRSEERRVGKEC